MNEQHQIFLEILCPELTVPVNGTITVRSTSQLQLGVGTTATYSCDPGYGLVGETTRTCEDTNGGTGVWSGDDPTCMYTLHAYRIKKFKNIKNVKG